MNIQLVTPAAVLLHGQFDKLIAEGTQGCFCILPRHIDYLVVLVPGILILAHDTGERYFAIDHGHLVKKNDDVLITVRRAIESDCLETLQATVQKNFLKMDAGEKAGMAAVASLEASFVRRLLELHQGEVVT